MGINYNYSEENTEKDTKIKLVPKGPTFYLNKEFPNCNNISLKEVLQNLLKSKYDLLENNQITASLSKQCKLLYQKKTDPNDFSFSRTEFEENKNSDNNNIFREQNDNNNINNNQNQLILNNNYNNNKKIIKEIFQEKENNNTNNNNKKYLSDYNLFFSSKSSHDNINKINTKPKQNILNDEKNKVKEKNSSKSFDKFYNKIITSKQKQKPHVKFRKYTDIEPTNLTQAGSLLKDIRKEYRFKKQLGGGHFGTVHKAYRINDKKSLMKYYAIKSIPMKNLSCNINDFMKEVDIISSLDHPNIIKFYESFHDNCFFHIVMELCKGKEIMYQMSNYFFLEEKKVTKIIFKVLLAIAHCHNMGVTHRDLKPENILFDSLKKDAEIKLIDFGLSRKYDKEQKMHSILGTPYYVAPEVLKGEYDEKCDIWSIGAMTYLMLCGEPPFNGNSNNEIFKKIVKENFKFKNILWKNISNKAKDFVKICLNKNSTKRPSAKEALNHPWFSNVIKEIHNYKKIKKEILLNIKKFNINYIFKKIVMKYLINNKITEEEKQIFKDSFYALDFNHNGFITQSDLKKAFNIFNIDIEEKQLNHLFNILPEYKNLGLGFSEFIMAGIDRKNIFNLNNLEEAFNYFDINKTGKIQFDNLNNALLRMGKRYVNSDDVNTIINEVVLNINKIKEKNKVNDNKGIKGNIISKDDFMIIFNGV